MNMARVISQSRMGFDSFDILEDCPSTPPLSLVSSSSPQASKPNRAVTININNKTNRFAVLEEIDIQQTQNVPIDIIPSPGSLSRQLERFYIGASPERKDACTARGKAPSRGHQKRLPLEADTFLPPPETNPKADRKQQQEQVDIVTEANSKVGEDTVRYPSSAAIKTTSRASVEEQWRKHDAGQFEYVLSVPISSMAGEKFHPDLGRSSRSSSQDPTADSDPSEKNLYFGCNLIHSQTLPGAGISDEAAPAPIYTLLATPIEDPEGSVSDKRNIASPGAMAIGIGAIDQPTREENTKLAKETLVTIVEPEQTAQPAYPHRRRNSDIEPVMGRSPVISVARIEDSFEALDQLEEQLEALDEVVRVERVPSPDKVHRKTAGTTKRAGPARTAISTSASRKLASGANTVRAQTTEMSRTGSLRKSSSVASGRKEDEKIAINSPAHKRDVARPTSLLSPKKPCKTTKPPTQPSFELPGEAVARRLKEQREARLTRASAAGKIEKAAAQSTPQRPRSARLPMRPTFELPGETISRRKREEHQAKLRAQEEEERRRREFKARPIRANLTQASGNYPRETAASRARQNSNAAATERPGSSVRAATSSDATSTTAKKRFTVPPAVSSASSSQRPVSANSNSSQQQQMQPRGRDRNRESHTTAAGSSPSQASRAASTSTGSTCISKGSSGATVTAEDMQLQKRRGREIYRRDNSLRTEEREREQREREALAKLARREAAERSRQLSREWAERQQAKRASMMPSASPVLGANVATAVR